LSQSPQQDDAIVPRLEESAEMRPLVSIIMAVRNGAETIGPAVRSIQLQTLRDWELIVIDDGSTDASASIVRTFSDARIRLTCETSSAGLATRLNQAVALSRGAFIARMDADDVCFPDRLARQVDRLQQEPRLDVLGCGAVVFDSAARLLGELPVGLTHEEITAQPFHGFPFPHPTWCGRAEWFRKHPYDPRLMKTQDQDLLLRTFKVSYFATLDEVLMGYRQDTLDLAKMLLGRRVFIGSLLGYAQHSGELFSVLRGIAMQFFKGGVDVATIGLGLNRLSQRNRLKSVRPAVAKQWQELQLRLGLSGEAG
jgi:glycosyltransferase involved in cell wall biosynthesis